MNSLEDDGGRALEELDDGEGAAEDGEEVGDEVVPSRGVLVRDPGDHGGDVEAEADGPVVDVGVGLVVMREVRPGQEKGVKFPTLEARISIGFDSIWLIFGRAIISRGELKAWMLLSRALLRKHPR